MNKKVIGLAVASVLAFSVQASDVPYSYAELGFASSSIGDDVSVDGDGFVLSGSAEFTENLYGFGQYWSSDFDGGFDLGYTSVGAGYKYPINATTDFNFEVSYRNFSADGGGESDDDSGHGIGVGIRSMVAPNVELGAKIESIDIEGSETFFNVNGMYHFGNGFAAGAEANFSDFFDFYGVKIRYTF